MVKEIGDSETIDTWSSTGSKVDPGLSKTAQGWALGERPPFEFMNFIQNLLGQKVNHALSWGIARWNGTTAYGVGAAVGHNGTLWVALVANTASEPTGGNSNWAPIATGTSPTQSQAVWNAGVDTTESLISPAKLAVKIAQNLAASALSQAIWNTGTDTTESLVSPAKLDAKIRDEMNATGAAPLFGTRAWAQFNGVSGVTINGSGNIASIVRNAVGDYTVAFSANMPTANYAVNGRGSDPANNLFDGSVLIYSRAVSGFSFYLNDPTDNLIRDLPDISLTVVC